MISRFSGRILTLGLVSVTAVGCAAAPAQTSTDDLKGAVAEALDSLSGTVAEASSSTGSEALCGTEVISVAVSQPQVSTAIEFNEDAAANVLELIRSIQVESKYEGFALSYGSTMPGLVDKYGNPSDSDVLWLCYTAGDVEMINLDNATFAKANILNMNTFGQDDVETTFR